MDALFLPLANALGASVDQIKVTYMNLRDIHYMALTFFNARKKIANIMSTHCIPSWTSLCASAILKTGAASSIQYHRGNRFLLPRSPIVYCLFPIAG
jgi:hypothetical protein